MMTTTKTLVSAFVVALVSASLVDASADSFIIPLPGKGPSVPDATSATDHAATAVPDFNIPLPGKGPSAPDATSATDHAATAVPDFSIPLPGKGPRPTGLNPARPASATAAASVTPAAPANATAAANATSVDKGDEVLIFSSGVELAAAMDEYCSGDANLISISQWDVSRLATFGPAFRFRTTCGSSLEGMKTWNTTGITSLHQAFFNSTIFQDIDFSEWNVGNVVKATGAFKYAQINANTLSDWKLTSATNVRNMFKYATGLSDANFTAWATVFHELIPIGAFGGSLFDESDYPSELVDEFASAYEANAPDDLCTTGGDGLEIGKDVSLKEIEWYHCHSRSASAGDASGLTFSVISVVGATVLLFAQ